MKSGLLRFNPRGLSGFSTADSEFVSIVCRARMVNTGDNGIILVRASEEYPTSSVKLLCSRSRGVCSRGYKLARRGCRTQVPLNGVRSVGGLTLVTVALLSLL
jgi:hypothetical protein